MEKAPFISIIFVCLGYYILAFLGWLRILRQNKFEKYVPLRSVPERIAWYYLSRSLRDCWGTPIYSLPGPEIMIQQRNCNGVKGGGMSKYTDDKVKCLNLASYNYLGFAENRGRSADFAVNGIYKYGLSTGATRRSYGTTNIHVELERLTSEFVGAEDALACGVGFTVNSLHLPMIISKGCLVLSDEKNHVSLIVGIKASQATVKVFRHNGKFSKTRYISKTVADVNHLEQLLKEAVYYGQKTIKSSYKPWKKIFIIVEGVYSMEGTMTPLQKIIDLKKKFKAFLYLDEAHSIGVMGKNGRGVVEYFGCDPKDVDIIMGTYTKSFGAAGGYIAGDKSFISYMRSQSYISKHVSAMSPPIAAHIIDVLKVLMGKDGTTTGATRISTLTRNSKYFRRKVNQMGILTNGCEDSPIVPIMCFSYSKTAYACRFGSIKCIMFFRALIRSLRKKNIACAGVVYPVTSYLECCIRVCLSASHTKDQLDYALKVIAEVVEPFGLKYSRLPQSYEEIKY